MTVGFAEAVLRHKAGQTDLAAAGYAEILAADPRHDGALCNLAVLEAGRGRLARAAELYSQALELRPRDGETLLNYANLLMRCGDAGLAESAYRRALEVQPGLGAAWFSLGRLLSDLGRHDEALEALDRAVHLLPNLVEARRERAIAMGEAGRVPEAVAALQAIAQADPLDGEAAFHEARLRHAQGDLSGAAQAYARARDVLGDVPEVLCNLGSVLNDLGRYGEAAAALQIAVAKRPAMATASNNLGIALDALGQTEEAIASYARAVEADPTLASAPYNLGRTLGRTGRRVEGTAWLKRAVSLDPAAPSIRVALASLLTDCNDIDEAAVHWQRATELAPGAATYHAALGYVLIRLKRPRKALRCAERAIELDPNLIDGYLVKSQAQRQTGDELAGAETRAVAERMVENTSRDPALLITHLFGLAGQCYHAGDFRGAARIYRRVLALDPSRDDVRARLIDSTLSLCDWTHYDAFVTELTETVRQDIAERLLRLDVFNLLALPVDNQLLFDAARSKAAALRALEGDPAPLAAPVPGGARPARLRIGFALPYTYFHSMPMVLKGIVEQLDRDRFETFGYSVQPCDGATFSRHFRPAFDTFRDIPLDDAAASAEIINRDGIDILIDTTGHTGINVLAVLAHRPAPVQAHYLGYGLTTGADYVDYLITDPRFMPPEWAGFCSERLVYMPDSFMATTRASFAPEPASRAAQGLPESGLVLANFNHPCKLEPRMVGAWMRLLREIPDAVLWLGGWAHDTRESLGRFADANGVARNRMVFAKILPHPAHMSRLRLADLALDNLHHGGGVTTVDALWAGVPLLTVKGATPAGRLGASLCHAVGVDDLVTDSLEAYTETGLALARDRKRLAAVRAKLAARLPTCALFDTARYRRGLEAALDLMWAHRGEPRGAPPLTVKPS